MNLGDHESSAASSITVRAVLLVGALFVACSSSGDGDGDDSTGSGGSLGQGGSETTSGGSGGTSMSNAGGSSGAASEGSGGTSTSNAGGSGTTSEGSGGTSTSTSDGNQQASCTGDDELEAACTTLCAAFAAADCTLLDLSVPYIYRLYVGDGDDDCVSECVSGDLRQGSLADAPTKCGPQLRAYIEKLATKECVGADPEKNWNGQWDWTGTDTETSDLTACGEACLDLPTCDATTCNGSMSEGDFSCSWACVGRTCEQMCN